MGTPPHETTTTTTVVVAPKSVALAYVLWIFLGQLGVHRFYLGRIGSGVVQLLMALFGYLLVAALGLGFFLLIPLWVWLFVDIFLIPGMARTSPAAAVVTTRTTIGPPPGPASSSGEPTDRPGV